MASFRNSCDNGCCSQHGGNNLGSLGGFRSGSSMLRNNSSSFPIGSLVSGSIQGNVVANLNGEIFGELSGKIDSLGDFLGCGLNFGSLGNLGNMALRLPFSVQFGNRTI